MLIIGGDPEFLIGEAPAFPFVDAVQRVACVGQPDIADDVAVGILRRRGIDANVAKALALSLAGSNPALYEGQAIRFNINVEQNLDPLLQSLRIGDNLEQRIEGGLK